MWSKEAYYVVKGGVFTRGSYMGRAAAVRSFAAPPLDRTRAREDFWEKFRQISTNKFQKNKKTVVY
jgi:hypothetical protein